MEFFPVANHPGTPASEHPVTHTASPGRAAPNPSTATASSLRLGLIGTAMSIGLGVALTSMVPASAQSMTTITAPRGGSTAVALRAPANASCELGTMSSRGAHSLTAFSDARGVVRYFLSVQRNARAGTLATLECRNATAHTLVGLTLIPGALAPVKLATRPARRATIADLATNARFGVLRGTPAGFDVTSASDAQLAQLNYPRRPNPHLNPTGYVIWRKLVTTPGAYVAPGAVADPKIRGPVARAQLHQTRRSPIKATNFSVATSPNWSGVVVNGQPNPFSSVWGGWNVPAVSTDGNIGASFSSTWVGMDGWGNNDVLQDGTEQDAWNTPPWSFNSYYAWYEFFPDSSHALSNVAVSPGDQVFAQSTAFIYPDGTVEGDYLLYDYTSNTGTFASELAPAGTVFSGASAEWVEERPQVNGGLWPMPDYGDVQMSSTAATTTDGNFYFADGSNVNGANDSQLNVIMTSDGKWSGDWLSNGYYLDQTDVGFHYINWL